MELSFTMQAVEYFSSESGDFQASYKSDSNRLERLSVWHDFFNRYIKMAKSAYDIGCGSGILACELAGRGVSTTGIDGSPDMLVIARNTAAHHNLTNVNFRQDILPIENTAFFEPADVVISSSVIEYLDSVSGTLQFMGRLLKNNGILLFSVSNRDSLSRKLVRIIYHLTGKPEYFGLLRHFMTPTDIQSELDNAGFECLEYTYFEQSDRVNRLLSLFMPTKFASNMIIVAAKKMEASA